VKQTRIVLLWVITQQVVVISYLLFLDSSPPKMGPTGCPKTSVRNYHYSQRNNAEEHGFLSYIRVHLGVIKEMIVYITDLHQPSKKDSD